MSYWFPRLTDGYNSWYSETVVQQDFVAQYTLADVVATDFVSRYASDDIRRGWFVTPLFYNLNNSQVNTFFKDYTSELYHFEGYLAESFDEVEFYTADGGPIDPETMFYPDYSDSWTFYRPGHISL